MWCPNIRIVLGLFLIFPMSFASAEEKLYQTEKQVTLTGIVQEGIGYDANDKREEYYLLEVEPPFSVAPDEFGDGAQGIRKIQLVPLGGVHIGKYFKKRIEIAGKLSYGITAHHHTKVLLEIDEASNVHMISTQSAR